MLSAGIAANALASKRRNDASAAAVRQAASLAVAMSERKRRERGEPDARAQHEHAAVPVVAAVGEVALGRRQIGLFDERGDSDGAFVRLAFGADVAVTGVGAIGPDAEDDDAAAGRGAHRLAQRRRECRRDADRVIGRRDHQDRVAARELARLVRGKRERRRGVAPDRLEQHARRLDADLAQLVDDREAMLLVGDDARRAHLEAVLGQRRQALRRLLEQRALAADAEREVLLRMQGTAERPEPGAAAAGQDHRDDHERCGGGHDCEPSWLATSLRSAEICERSCRYSLSFLARNDCVSRRRWRMPLGVSV